jgi:hypothetical protein
LGLLALVIVIYPALVKEFWDDYVPYSGTVVAHGLDWHFFARPSFYIVVADASGHRYKRYVGKYCHVDLQVGTFVTKEKHKAGLGAPSNWVVAE